ncbi:hypothetical protein JNUCC0626_11825 [Lentzea sp. JNUCC 0626]|uniref:hypothetical protein n=1 Tax=Lentzea sp. JNUCC 0626 TaxID=3367513 RepID=UPI00374A48C0
MRDIGPSGDAEQITDLVIAALAGAIVCQAQGLPAPSPAGFREILPAQLKVVLG